MGRVSRLNRNILECKSVWIDVSRVCIVVLIETYWNVNPFACCTRLGVRGS